MASAEVLIDSRITGLLRAVIILEKNTPNGIESTPDMMPKAKYFSSFFWINFNPTGMVNTIVAPAIYPVYIAIIQLSPRLCQSIGELVPAHIYGDDGRAAMDASAPTSWNKGPKTGADKDIKEGDGGEDARDGEEDRPDLNGSPRQIVAQVSLFGFTIEAIAPTTIQAIIDVDNNGSNNSHMN